MVRRNLFSGGDFVVTYTTSGDPADVLFQSDATTYENASTLIAPLFNANEQDTSPFVVSLINSAGGSLLLDDPRFPPTARFFHADMSLGSSDVYDDEMLTNAILTNHMFGDISGDIDIAESTSTFTYTPAGNSGVVSLTVELSPAPGSHYNINTRSTGSITSQAIYSTALNQAFTRFSFRTQAVAFL